MLKKIAISIMGLFLLASIVLAGYKIFEPNSRYEEVINIESFYISFNTVEEYTLSAGNNTTHYYLFCDPNNNDCKYLYDSVFPSVTAKNNNINIKTIIEYIDISEIIDNDDFLSNLKKWNISTYPALVSCDVEDNQIIINNTLEFDTNHPLNSEDIVNWMILNDIYSGESQVILPS
ncbi:MAG: hypothetical protein WBH68_05260 [Erysipelotrichaceae bacterium]|jgi:hypothetical protein